MGAPLECLSEDAERAVRIAFSGLHGGDDE
jgi:hypothetical protein